MFRAPSSAGLISTWHHVAWPVTPISHASRNNNRRLNTHHANIYSFGTRSRGVQFDRADLISDSFQLYESYLCMSALYMYERRSIWNAARAGRHIAGNDTRYVLVDWRGLCSVSRVKLKSVLRLLRSLTEIDRSFKVVFSNNVLHSLQFYFKSILRI